MRLKMVFTYRMNTCECGETKTKHSPISMLGDQVKEKIECLTKLDCGPIEVRLSSGHVQIVGLSICISIEIDSYSFPSSSFHHTHTHTAHKLTAKII